MIWIFEPAIRDVPKPGFVPQNAPAVDVGARVEDGFPSGLTKLVQLARLPYQGALPQPPLDLPLAHVELTGKLHDSCMGQPRLRFELGLQNVVGGRNDALSILEPQHDTEASEHFLLDEKF